MTTTNHEPSDSTSSQNPPTIAPLHRGALNLPNLITISRLVLAVILFAMIYLRAYPIAAAVLFVVAALTDALDGWIARRYGMITTLGRILDPFADKMIVGGAFVFLVDQKEASGVNAWMAVTVLGREMFVTSLRGFLEQHGVDFSAALTGKIKMALQCVAVTVSLLSLAPEFDYNWFRLCRDILLWVTVAVTLYSGVEYVLRAAAMLRSRS